MKDEAKTQLAKILGDYDAKLAETARVDAENRAAHAAFPDRFATLKREVVRPALEEIAAMLNASGHEASVREQEESSTAGVGVKSAAVSLRIVPKPFAGNGDDSSPIVIEIAFSANRATRKVAVSSSNTMINHGGAVGKRGEYEVDAVTADVAARHVVQTLGEAFGREK
jgi:hypothetical protein